MSKKDKDEWDKLMNKAGGFGNSDRDDGQEVLRITFYKAEGGIKAESRGMVKGTQDLTAIAMVISDVLNTTINMMSKHNGVGEVFRESKSHEFKPHDWETDDGK